MENFMSTSLDKVVERSELKKEERTDPLKEKQTSPDRVFYATGVLLDAEDFKAEQTYHRGQLARVLAHLHGSGTAAGLKVLWIKPSDDLNAPGAQQEEIRVEPGIAVDRLGRIIEVPRNACIRLDRWFKDQKEDDLVQALYAGNEAPLVNREGVDGVVEGTDPVEGVVADLFIRHVVCERGKTPAFAAGPFDALDAVEPSRLRDGYELKLFLRQEHRADDLPSSLPMPEKTWPTESSRLHASIFEAWHRATDRTETPGVRGASELKPLREHASGQDTTFVFLARVVLPAERMEATPRIRRKLEDVRVDNHIRPFVYTATALARLTGL
jgi:hypothetical protein